MILYHFADPENVESILRQGLIPQAVPRVLQRQNIPDHEKFWMTGNRPVVWLSSGDDDWVGVRLAVQVAPNNKRLISWLEWTRRHGIDPHRGIPFNYLELADRAWMYFGHIPPERIKLFAREQEQAA